MARKVQVEAEKLESWKERQDRRVCERQFTFRKFSVSEFITGVERKRARGEQGRAGAWLH